MQDVQNELLRLANLLHEYVNEARTRTVERFREGVVTREELREVLIQLDNVRAQAVACENAIAQITLALLPGPLANLRATNERLEDAVERVQRVEDAIALTAKIVAVAAALAAAVLAPGAGTILAATAAAIPLIQQLAGG